MRYGDRSNIWREHAAILRRYGVEPLASVLEQCAAEIEQDELVRSAERVGLAEAEAVSGFTRGHLRRLVRENKLRNVGTEENPEFYVGDLPRKPGYTPENKRLASDETPVVNSRMQVARAVVRGG